nr:dihydrofolate reductase [Sneathiella glossodoripedis]
MADSKESALKLAREDAAQRSAEEIMIIGGGEIYKLFCGDIERYYITFVHTEMVGDTYFDPLPGEAWKVIFEEAHTASERNDYPHTFRILERNSAP